MLRILYVTLLTTLLQLPSVLMAQKHITLFEAVDIAQKQSLSYKIALNTYQSSNWNYRNFQISFYPTLFLDGTTPNYARTVTKITLPNGDDTFVNQNQAYSSLNLGLSQNVGATGGVFTLGSTLNRIDVFGGNRQVSYSSIPVSISYNQETIGFNEFKWLKRIEPLRFEVADRTFLTSMEQISTETVNLFFSMLAAQARQALSAQNFASTDTLLQISRERFKLGTVSKSELLQLRLSLLTAQKQLTQDSINLVLARQQFSQHLALPTDIMWQLSIPEEVRYFDVTFDRALQMAKDNNKDVLQFRLDRLEAEKNLAKVKAESKLKFNVQANFGLSNVSPDIPGLLRQLENQQHIMVGFSLPILDWGNAKTKRLRAEADLAMVESEIEQGQMQIEQEVALQVAKWGLQQQQIEVVRESKVIAEENYELEKQRYVMGSITLNDLNIAQQAKDNGYIAYFEAIRAYWELYFSLRRITLFDFENNDKIRYVVREGLKPTN